MEKGRKSNECHAYPVSPQKCTGTLSSPFYAHCAPCRTRDKKRVFHDRKLKYVKASSFRSFHETETPCFIEGVHPIFLGWFLY